MHSDERGPQRDGKREMLRLKTPSVGKLFNYLRYCGGADARKFETARKPREKENGSRAGDDGAATELNRF